MAYTHRYCHEQGRGTDKCEASAFAHYTRAALAPTLLRPALLRPRLRQEVVSAEVVSAFRSPYEGGPIDTFDNPLTATRRVATYLFSPRPVAALLDWPAIAAVVLGS